MTTGLDISDPTFIADLRESREAVDAASRWLSSLGFPVVVRPTFERPDPSQMAEFADNGDLEILQRVEVKRRPDIHFTSKEDFPYESIIVDVCHAFDKARPKPYAYIIFNATMTHAAIVKSDTRAQWARVEKVDRKKSRTRNFYECPISLVRFARVPQP